MASLQDLMAHFGVQRPDITIAACREAGIPVPVGCVVLEHETGGGRMIWGHDPGDPQGVYAKGGPVTEANYRRYRDLVRAGKMKRQGAGDAQLTAAPYQDRADSRHGVWDPYSNQWSGFAGLAALIRSHGGDVRTGFRAYNGSGDDAERYATTSMERLTVWQSRLGGAVAAPIHPSVGAVPAPATPPAPPPRRRAQEDTEMLIFTDPPAAHDAPPAQWPVQRVAYGFDPPGGWGGRGVLSLHWSALENMQIGGYLVRANWWIRKGTGVGDPHQPRDPDPINVSGIQVRYIGSGLELVPPPRADELELLLAAPAGVHIFPTYEH